MLLNVVNLKTSMPAMSSPWPTCGLVEGFMQPSLGCGCSMSSLHTYNLSFIGTKLPFQITLMEWLKMSNSYYHCS